MLNAAPHLKIIANVAVGYDNIDAAAATERGIVVTNTPDVLTETAADLAFALLLAIARRVAAALTQGIIRGAALDVFEEEPLMHPGLAQFHDRLIVAPHIGSASVETRQNMSLLAVRNVIAVLSGNRPLTPVR